MSIDINGYIKDYCIDETILETALLEYFNGCNGFTKTLLDSGSVIYEKICDDKFYNICFSDSCDNWYYLSSPAILRNSNCTEFVYEQAISFSMNKEDLSTETVMQIVMFFSFLRERVESDILVTSDAHNEICQLKKCETLWSETASSIKEMFECQRK